MKTNLLKKLTLVLVLSFVAAGAFAQDSDAKHLKKYQYVKNLQVRLDKWHEHYTQQSGRLAQIRRRQYKYNRIRLYTEFFDLRSKDIAQLQENLKTEIAHAPKAPFIAYNILNKEQLATTRQNKKLFVRFLKNYPDNVVLLTADELTLLFKDDAPLEKTVNHYYAYLKNYNQNPAAVHFTERQTRTLIRLKERGNLESLYEALHEFSDRALRKWTREKEKEQAKRKIAKELTK